MSLPVCKFYEINQTCRFGKSCRFSHTLTQRPPPLSKAVYPSEVSNDEVTEDNTQSTTRSTTLERLHFSTHNDSTLSRNQAKASQSSTSRSNSRTINERDGTICSYFARGYCRYGRFCKFSHDLPQSRVPHHGGSGTKSTYHNRQERKFIPPRLRNLKEDLSCSNVPERIAAPQKKQDESEIEQPSQSSLAEKKNPNEGKNRPRPREKACAYFKAGQCKRGKCCKFSHNIEIQIDDGSLVTKPSRNQEGKSSFQEKQNIILSGKKSIENEILKPDYRARPLSSRQVFTFTEVEEVGIDKIRNGEIEAIKRRFPKDKIVHRNEGEAFVATFKFTPTDPDWPFDVKEFAIEIVIPPAYPNQMLTVTLPLDQDLPATVRSFVEISIQEWIQERHEQFKQTGKVEVVFRTFLRWLDRTIEEITTEALLQLKRELTARAAGFEFIPAKKLQARFQAAGESSGADDKEVAESEEDDEVTDTSDENEDSTSEEEEEDADDHENVTLELQPQQKGTEISLKHLQLKENAAALLFQRLKVVLQCGRCKGHSDLYVTQGNVTTLSCNKCNNDMYVTYRPGLLHQFSSVLGYLDVDGCQAFDLVLQDCRACVSCMACNKQTTIDGLVTGQMVDGWCKACNAKFKIAAEAVKLTHLAPSGIDTSSAPLIKAATSKPKKPPKDPSIREGYPLPEFGTCKHYKHSYRWLRFPCCGKAYPCDVCHDKKEDHEMTFANRMICGHCCKEQNYSGSRPCTGCGEHMTKVRSAHWEGGSGCRDKIAMSKGDTQKYKNMNKTVSNKKKLEAAPKKKNTKLRHV